MGAPPDFCKAEDLGAFWFELLVENAESVPIPKQDLDPIATPVQEQEQVPGARVLVKDLLRSTHQAIEAVIHVRRCRAQEDPHVGKVCHDVGAFQGRNVPTARITSTNTAWPTPSGSRTMPPLDNSISTGDALSVIGTNAASPDSAR